MHRKRADRSTEPDRNSVVNSILHVLLNYDEADALNVLRYMRSCDSLEDVMEFVGLWKTNSNLYIFPDIEMPSTK